MPRKSISSKARERKKNIEEGNVFKGRSRKKKPSNTRSNASKRDREAIQDRQRQERAGGMRRGRR